MHLFNLRHCQTTGLTVVTAVGLLLLVGISSPVFAHANTPAPPSGEPALESSRQGEHRSSATPKNLAHPGGMGDSSAAAGPESHHRAPDVEAPDGSRGSAGTTGHDHNAHGTWADNQLEVFLAWLGRFHPALTNFPIALLVLAALAELLCRASGQARPGLQQGARFCAQWGAATALLTAIAGWFYAGFAVGGDDPVMAAHRWNGTLIGLLAPLLWWLARGETRRRYQPLLFLVALLVLGNGYLGGRLLYGADHYDYPQPPSDHSHAPGGH